MGALLHTHDPHSHDPRLAQFCGSNPPADFIDCCLAGHGRPALLQGVVEQWPAAQRWSFATLRQELGSDTVLLTDRPGGQICRTSMAEYIDYIEGHSTHSLPQTRRPWYLNHYRPFTEHPQWCHDFSEPSCLDNWFRHLAGAMALWYEIGFTWLLVGPAGTKTPYHRDVLATHAWLAQIRGQKHCVLIPPDDPHHPLSLTLRQGDFLVIPQAWMHEVSALEPSITLTANFINATNFGDFLQAIYNDIDLWCLKGRLGGLTDHKAEKEKRS